MLELVVSVLIVSAALIFLLRKSLGKTGGCKKSGCGCSKTVTIDPSVKP